MRKTTRNAALLATLAGSTMLGCDAAKNLLAELAKQGQTGPRKLSDEDAFKHLAKDHSAAPDTNVSAVSKVIDSQVAAEAGQKQADTATDPEVVKLLKSVSYNRRLIETKKFDHNTMANFVPSGKSRHAFKEACDSAIDVASLPHDEYTIPHLEKIPVRDQKYRGTCASFSGVGAIEYAALNDTKSEIGSNPALPTLDLAEQRFYWTSKPECQAAGACPLPGSGEGSWYGTGFDASVNGGALDIPLEQDCAYNPMPTDNDTQSPQPATCSTGAVEVKKVEFWCGLKQLIDFLDQGYAVPYASPLTSNWESNDGLILAKDIAPGESVHAGGHAYLIVGYKKLPASVPASEGGLCFIIKNSWGTGWGAGGFSCMSLGWMKTTAFDGFFDYQQPVPVEVLLREDLQAQSLPPDEPVDDNTAIDEGNGDNELPPDDEEERLDPIPPDVDPNGDVVVDVVPEEDAGVEEADAAAGEPDAGTTTGGDTVPGVVDDVPVDEFSDAHLSGPNQAFYHVKVAKKGTELRIKGILKGGTETTPVRVNLQGNKLLFKGDVVGEYDAAKAKLSLCTEDYTPLCALRYRTSGKVLYIQFRDDDLRTVKAADTGADKGQWQDVDLGQGRQYGVFIPTDALSVDFLLNPKTFVRTGGGEPSRLSLRQMKAAGGLGFDVMLQGMRVGELPLDNITNSSFCSGSYSKVCSFVGSDKLDVVPSNKRKL